ncbi:LPXTG cell wall anchor domain-containing protein [Sanguibacter sp. HDW7]|uniref:LPXTG cell wall anchor domain-containing protein n=1 Tax=Sanguibacter sp. HDW7 TaxID=2714931 RepID=UPI00140D849E|nr:LPXTG cell wall anchor domain-containing protein [Sanguibacter sp. HDW7]QIK82187.1 LPXTG cell wall anchor domain-containing protein [Sanguibacter sp. HDW7]
MRHRAIIAVLLAAVLGGASSGAAWARWQARVPVHGGIQVTRVVTLPAPVEPSTPVVPSAPAETSALSESVEPASPVEPAETAGPVEPAAAVGPARAEGAGTVVPAVYSAAVHSAASTARARAVRTAAADGTVEGSAGILVSADGRTFAPDLTTGIFPDTTRMVPGGTTSADLWVRSSGDVDARLRLELLDVAADDPDLAAALTLGVDAVADGTATTTPTTVAEADACTVLVRDIDLPAGRTVHLRATAALGNLVGTQGQGSSATFRYRVVASDTRLTAPEDPGACAEGEPDGASTAPPTTPQPDDGADGPGTLPATGAQVVLLAAGASAMLLLGGMLRRRRGGQRSVAAASSAPTDARRP